jgi:formate-dependent nitrite reductase complex subunit NrfG
MLVFEATKQPLPQLEPAQDIQSGSELMARVQQALQEDPNDSKNWFTLGQYYMQLGDFAAADTCFDYSIRLSNTPYAGQFAARATAKYYLDNQTLTAEVYQLIDEALAMDPLNDTALLLLASEHYLNSNYQQATDIWMRLLDSNRQGIDRVSLIEKINQTKARL